MLRIPKKEIKGGEKEIEVTKLDSFGSLYRSRLSNLRHPETVSLHRKPQPSSLLAGESKSNSIHFMIPILISPLILLSKWSEISMFGCLDVISIFLRDEPLAESFLRS
jgi:hypothetical protein